MGSRPWLGLPAQWHEQGRSILPLSPTPIHVLGQSVPTPLLIWQAEEVKAGHRAGRVPSLGTSGL